VRETSIASVHMEKTHERSVVPHERSVVSPARSGAPRIATNGSIRAACRPGGGLITELSPYCRTDAALFRGPGPGAGAGAGAGRDGRRRWHPAPA